MISLEIKPAPAEQIGLLSRLPLRTERLTIREFQLADARALFALHRDPRGTRYAGGTRTKEQSFESLYRIINRVRQSGFGTFAIELCAQKEVIGWVGIQAMPDCDRLEILYALMAGHWGNGFATEAGNALLGAAFTLPGFPVDEVFALVFPQNIGSIRVLEKFRMNFVDYLFDQATQRYACLYGISRAEFLAGAINQSSSKK